MKNFIAGCLLIPMFAFMCATADAAPVNPIKKKNVLAKEVKIYPKAKRKIVNGILPGDIINKEFVRLTTDSSGNGVAIWRAYDTVNSNHMIQYSTLINGNSWTSPQTLSDPVNEDASNVLRIAIDSAGNVVAAWTAYDAIAGAAVAKVASLPAVDTGSWGTWNSPITVSDSGNENVQDDIQLAVDSGNKFRLTWTTVFFEDMDSSVRLSTATAFDSDPWTTITLSD